MLSIVSCRFVITPLPPHFISVVLLDHLGIGCLWCPEYLPYFGRQTKGPPVLRRWGGNGPLGRRAFITSTSTCSSRFPSRIITSLSGGDSFGIQHFAPFFFSGQSFFCRCLLAKNPLTSAYFELVNALMTLFVCLLTRLSTANLFRSPCLASRTHSGSEFGLCVSLCLWRMHSTAKNRSEIATVPNLLKDLSDVGKSLGRSITCYSCRQ